MKQSELDEIKIRVELAAMVSADVVKALLAEVERLRGLIKAVEWSMGIRHNECQWCGNYQPMTTFYGVDEGHKPDCPAFGE